MKRTALVLKIFNIFWITFVEISIFKEKSQKKGKLPLENPASS